MQEFRLHDREYFFRFTRMSPERFEELLKCVGPFIAKSHCRPREPISPGERLLLTLRYLATGDSQQSLAFSFRIGRTTVSNILRETCDGIWEALSKEYVKVPSTTNDSIEIANGFNGTWNYPHCLGAIVPPPSPS